MEKRLLEAVEKTRAPPPPSPKEKKYVPPSPEEPHYYYYEFPPEAEAPNQVNAVGHWNPDGNWVKGKQMDAPWRDHPNFKWNDQSPRQPPQPSTQQTQPSEGQPNWPVRIQERLYIGGNIVQSGQGNWSDGPQGNCSSGSQSNWSGRQQEGNWGYNSGRQPNNQVVSYIPPHQRGNQQHQGNQPYHQPQYQSEHYGQSDYPQPSYGGGPSNKRYNRHTNEGPIEEAQKEQRAALDMLTKQLSQVAMSLGELRGNEGKIPATGRYIKASLHLQVPQHLHLDRAEQSPVPLIKPPEEEIREKRKYAVRPQEKVKAKELRRPSPTPTAT
ncbi:calcium homeostasis endoplasmic reticulum protein-like [Salvia splendens]|uniref:calcium homeostasis endoplasmic reticulum protein-like n=1 Tax=Salvia splendens TaxID=180675 RepID=UPI001C258D63|nr:calcium homeostasis endoplasmic reticulum protein-like [Salvia splendens]